MRDRKGRMVLGQWPNPALAVWLVTLLVRWTGVLDAAHNAKLAGVGRGALIVWALDESLRGSNPARRLLGALVLAWQVVQLLA